MCVCVCVCVCATLQKAISESVSEQDQSLAKHDMANIVQTLNDAGGRVVTCAMVQKFWGKEQQKRRGGR